jgi:hypothetical protein
MTLETYVFQKDAAAEPTDRDLQFRIRVEFAEMPGLKLTLRQASRLFHADAARCERALARLVAAGTLSIDEGLFVLTPRRAPCSTSPDRRSVLGMAPVERHVRRRCR